MLQCIFVGLMTHACWLHWEKVMKNWHSKWKPKRYETTLSKYWQFTWVFSNLTCVCPVLLEGVLCWRCGENGSAQTGKVSDCWSTATFLVVFTYMICLIVAIVILVSKSCPDSGDKCERCLFVLLLPDYMNSWTSLMMLPSVTCSTSKTFFHAG